MDVPAFIAASIARSSADLESGAGDSSGVPKLKITILRANVRLWACASGQPRGIHPSNRAGHPSSLQLAPPAVRIQPENYGNGVVRSGPPLLEGLAGKGWPVTRRTRSLTASSTSLPI